MLLTVVLEKTLESPLDCKKIQPVHPKGDQSWVFIGRPYAEGETPILWPPHAKSWLIGKDPHDARDWGQEEKETTEDEMVGRHHWLDGHGWVNSRSWWWTRRPGMLRFMGLQRVGHDWVTELNLTESIISCNIAFSCPPGQTRVQGIFIYVSPLLGGWACLAYVPRNGISGS